MFFKETTNQSLAGPFVHKENVVNEYKDQILLPHMFSRSGPFISTGDVNKDGTGDFYIGGAAGQAGSLYLQQNGKFVTKDLAPHLNRIRDMKTWALPCSMWIRMEILIFMS